MTDPRLQRLLGGPLLAGLRQRLRQRYAPLPPGVMPPPLRLARLQPEEHAALAALLGRPGRFAASMWLDLAAIDSALQRAGLATGLRDALQQLDGPIINLAEQRNTQQAAWAALAGSARHTLLAALLDAPPGLGLLKRLVRQPGPAAQALLQQADAVLQRLPAAGLARAQLAALALGDAHALDRGAPVASLVLAAWRAARCTPAEPDTLPASTDDPGGSSTASSTASTPASTPASDESDRAVWASAGVLVNELARPALALNLPLASGALLLPGEPSYLSLRQLLRAPPAWGTAGRVVFVCENPNLVAIAADRLGGRCAALVCTDGMPAAAQRVLLQQLAAAGATLHYHGDFDWPGLRIANQVHTLSPAWLPWRFSATDYRAACLVGSGRPLVGDPVAASWDATLADAMQAAGRAIDEEALADRLLDDLGAASA